jgi:DNA-binding LytR/AlgR family response regulator
MELRCIVIDDEPYMLRQLEELITTTPGIILIKSFDNAFEAMNYLHENGNVDLIFSDIGMPFINGIEAAKLLRPYCDFLVFITGHREYSEESYEVGVDGYLLKPLMKVKFILQIQRLMTIRSKQDKAKVTENTMLVKGNLKNKYLNIHHEEIMYIKAMSNYIKVFLVDKMQTTYLTLSDMEETLKEQPAFLRINRSEIISFNHVKEIDGFQVILKNGEKFSVSKGYRKSFEESVKKRLAGGRAY